VAAGSARPFAVIEVVRRLYQQAASAADKPNKRVVLAAHLHDPAAIL